MCPCQAGDGLDWTLKASRSDAAAAASRALVSARSFPAASRRERLPGRSSPPAGASRRHDFFSCSSGSSSGASASEYRPRSVACLATSIRLSTNLDCISTTTHHQESKQVSAFMPLKQWDLAPWPRMPVRLMQ